MGAAYPNCIRVSARNTHTIDAIPSAIERATQPLGQLLPASLVLADLILRAGLHGTDTLLHSMLAMDR